MKALQTTTLTVLTCCVLCTPQILRAHTESVEDASSVKFETSCSAEVSGDFNKAVALLHNMTYHLAEERFKEILERDPGCGMAYWGVAMSYIHPLWFEDVGDELMSRGSDLLAHARQSELTKRESDYVAALEAFYQLKGAPLFERLDAYAEGFAKVYSDYPDDIEAHAFFALTHLINQRPGTL